jgi:hypothetical protein
MKKKETGGMSTEQDGQLGHRNQTDPVKPSYESSPVYTVNTKTKSKPLDKETPRRGYPIGDT